MDFTHEANPVRVQAHEITAIEEGMYQLDGKGWFKPFDAAGMTARYTPVPGDYLVTQEDGYTYFNPKDVFERKYRSL